MRTISKFAPLHGETDVTRPKKMTRGLREHMFDVHETLRAPLKMNIIKNVKNNVLPGLGHFLTKVYYALRLPEKMSPRHPKCRTCHTESSLCSKSKMTTVFQNETLIDPFKTSSKFACTCHTKRLPKPPLILTHACRRLSNVQKAPCLSQNKCYICHACHAEWT